MQNAVHTLHTLNRTVGLLILYSLANVLADLRKCLHSIYVCCTRGSVAREHS